MSQPEAAFFLITLPFALWAAWSDLARMKITNRLNLWLLAAFLVSAPFLLAPVEILTRLGIAAAALAIGFVLNQAGKFGGGDAKYIAAFMPFVTPATLSLFLFVLAAALLAAVATHRLARALGAERMTPGWKSWRSRKFPMGLGLSGGFSIYLAITGFGLTALPAGTG